MAVPFSGSNAYSGGTTVAGGTLVLASSNALGTGTLLLASGTLAGSGQVSAVIAESGTVSANLGGNGGFVKSTAGTVLLSGNNNYGGGTTVSTGVLQMDSSGALPTNGNPHGQQHVHCGLQRGADRRHRAGQVGQRDSHATQHQFVQRRHHHQRRNAGPDALSPASNLVIGDGASVVLNFGNVGDGFGLGGFGAPLPAVASALAEPVAPAPAGISTVPEPGTLALLAAAIVGLLFPRQRKDVSRRGPGHFPPGSGRWRCAGTPDNLRH